MKKIFKFLLKVLGIIIFIISLFFLSFGVIGFTLLSTTKFLGLDSKNNKPLKNKLN